MKIPTLLLKRQRPISDQALLASLAVAGIAAAVVQSMRRISFRDRVVLITGGSRGLGLVLARRFGREGARLCLLARDGEELERAAWELRESGVEVETFIGDVTKPSTARDVVAQTVRRYGRLDVLVNNAGTIIVGPLESHTEDDYELALATHFWAPLRLMEAALPELKATRGRIVNISSIGGRIAVPHLAAYSASKFALAGLSDAYRAELRQAGVAVTTVFPGLLRTGSHIRALFKGRREREFGWFALGSATPLSSASADRAARKIVEACRRGAPQLIISVQAKAMALVSALFPNLFAFAVSRVASFLPTGGANEAREGLEVRGAFPPSWLTVLPDRASRQNNELGAWNRLERNGELLGESGPEEP